MALFCLLALVGCQVKVEEKKRSASPNGQLEAVIAIKQTDATVSTPWEVYLVPSGQPVKGDPVFRGARVKDGVSVSWLSDSEVKIATEEAQIFIQEKSAEVNGPSGKSQIQITYDIPKVID